MAIKLLCLASSCSLVSCVIPVHFLVCSFKYTVLLSETNPCFKFYWHSICWLVSRLECFISFLRVWFKFIMFNNCWMFWKRAPLLIILCSWKERDAWNFENCFLSEPLLWDRIFSTLLSMWCFPGLCRSFSLMTLILSVPLSGLSYLSLLLYLVGGLPILCLLLLLFNS